ncbi:MAG TPA: 16S rRNA (cytosine(967)-C(5))-methyltransferase RsmB [Actinomycetota bacterium]|nr:16S rRNA (cytosine(967)-C(5))-methyltransferase RsmB [Actinomycetota bacterium]
MTGRERARTRRGRPRRADDRPTPRSVASDVVRRVTEEGAYSNLALSRTLSRAGLEGRDAAFATELTLGTLRRLRRIDHALAPLLERPLETAPKAARALLRVGAYQLLFLRTPAHAAVAETVALAEPRHRGFVNAVLRRLSTAPEAEPAGDDDESVALRTGLDPWAVRELRRLLGDEEAEAAAAALAQPAPTTIRANPCRTSLEELERELSASGVRTERGSMSAGSLIVAGSSPAGLPGFGEGRFTVQDQASTFVVQALDPRPGERVLDACAGPGGKAGDIACRVTAEGALVAADVHEARARLVRTTLERLGAQGHVLVQDGRRPALRGPFDRILVEAPCSGLGSARRRPELLWRTRREELSGLARLQVGIVSALAELLRPGGVLVYSVCTFPRAETDAACDAVLRRRPELEPVRLAGPEGAAPRIRLWPHRHGVDAMFVAAFARRG